MSERIPDSGLQSESGTWNLESTPLARMSFKLFQRAIKTLSDREPGSIEWAREPTGRRR